MFNKYIDNCNTIIEATIVSKHDINQLNDQDLFVDVGNVRFGVGHLDQPFLAVLANNTKVIFERPQSHRVQCFLFESISKHSKTNSQIKLLQLPNQ